MTMFMIMVMMMRRPPHPPPWNIGERGIVQSILLRKTLGPSMILPYSYGQYKIGGGRMQRNRRWYGARQIYYYFPG